MMKKAKKIPIHEIFGPTIQGEGQVVGRKTMFVRTGGCDYSCSWCDSAFTWNGSQKATLMTAEEIIASLIEKGTHESGKLNFNHVTISGGNPALFGQPMEDLIDMLYATDIQVGLETQGTIWQDWFCKIDDLTISPKPPSSGMATDWDKLDNIVLKLDEQAIELGYSNYTMKVVIFDDADFEYAKQVYNRYKPTVFYVSVGNEDAHEEGSIAPRLLSKLDWLWEKVLQDPEANNWRPLPQLHTLVWANKRGV